LVDDYDANQKPVITITIAAKSGFSVDGSIKVSAAGADITKDVNVKSLGSGKFTFELPAKDVVVSAAFKTKLPDRNDPNTPAWNEPKGGARTDWDGVDYAPVQNINNPITDNYWLQGGGGVDEDGDGIPNINDPDHGDYTLGGGGGVDDDLDGTLNKDDPKAWAYYLPGGKGYSDSSSTPATELLPGDVDNDGDVDLVDAQLVLKLQVGLIEGSDVFLPNIWALISASQQASYLQIASLILKLIIGL
jgi:hypothetical protein